MKQEPQKKVEKLAGLMNSGNWHSALRLAASWPRLGEHEKAIRQAWAAESNPNFYRQLGKDVDKLVAGGIAALKARYASYCKSS